MKAYFVRERFDFHDSDGFDKKHTFATLADAKEKMSDALELARFIMNIPSGSKVKSGYADDGKSAWLTAPNGDSYKVWIEEGTATDIPRELDPRASLQKAVDKFLSQLK